MKRQYESMIVFDGTLSDDMIQKEHKQIEEFLSANADFEKADVWGKRTLAYPIKKKRSGYYVLFLFEAEGDIPAALEKHVKLNENVLRIMTVLRNLKYETLKQAAIARRAKQPEVSEAAVESKSESEQIEE